MAKTCPTDRSTSPQMSNMISPHARIAHGATNWLTVSRFAFDKNVDRIAPNVIARMTQTTAIPASGARSMKPSAFSAWLLSCCVDLTAAAVLLLAMSDQLAMGPDLDTMTSFELLPS